jgi:DNA-binding NtrC family response regulator
MIVEDEEIVRNLTRELLESEGYRVLEAKDGETAFAIVESHKGTVDLLITDVIMPRKSGPGVAGDLSLKYPEMKVLFISGYTDDEIAHHGILDPGINFLQKPFAPVFLARKVREVLAQD